MQWLASLSVKRPVFATVGIVIDDAIVVLENIYRFVEEKGRPPMQAATRPGHRTPGRSTSG